MLTLGKKIVKYRIPILILSIILLIPSVIGMANTRINYDMLTYLPSGLDTVEGQDILLEDFSKGGFSLIMVDGMTPLQVSQLKEKFEAVDHVATVLWYDSIMDLSIPMEMLPEKFYDAFNKDDTTMMAVFFDTSTSADETMDAVKEIRKIAGEKCFVSGLSACVTDLKDLCEKEEPIYVGLAVLLACAAMFIFLDSFILPFIFLASIGIAIAINMGTNIFLGEISYITKALSAVLQLAVTMDYSIFLWHSYKEEKLKYPGENNRAMAHAISNTITSVLGSSITTIAGFISLCFMSFTLGKDLGIVMAKGVLLGVIGCVTTLPALILLFDKLIEKTEHKEIIPNMDRAAKRIVKHFYIYLIIFAVILVPALIGYKETKLYYDFGNVLPKDMEFVIANTKLQDTFDISTTHMILCDSNMSNKDAKAMMSEIEDVDGIKYVLGFDSVVGNLVPEDILPDSLTSLVKSDRYQLILVNSSFAVSSDEVNNQIDEINTIIKKYDEKAMLIGEAPCTKDMISITDHDFKVVSIISIIAIFVIIVLVLRNAALPIILVAVIEFAIFINLGIPYYTGTELPFIAPICISTIQLGATVDYAILMTSRFRKELKRGQSKHDAIVIALSTSIPSIIVSAMGFFAATFGVALYSDIDIISSMCNLMARGAIISMLCVIFILPAFLTVFARKSKKIDQLEK